MSRDEINKIKRDILIEIMLRGDDYVVPINLPSEVYETLARMYRIEGLIDWSDGDVENTERMRLAYGNGWIVTDKGRAWLESHR